MGNKTDLEPAMPLGEPAEFSKPLLYNPPLQRCDCDRCGAKDVEEGSSMHIHCESMRLIALERYGKVFFALCPSCAVEYYVRSFLGK